MNRLAAIAALIAVLAGAETWQSAGLGRSPWEPLLLGAAALSHVAMAVALVRRRLSGIAATRQMLAVVAVLLAQRLLAMSLPASPTPGAGVAPDLFALSLLPLLAVLSWLAGRQRWWRERRAARAADAATNELRRHELFQFEHLPLALIEWDSALRVRRWSRQAEDLLGWSAAEVVGQRLREAGVLLADEADDHEQVMEAFRSGARTAMESLRRTCHRDGRQLWYRWFSHSLPGPDGRPAFFFTAGLDVTPLIEQAQALDAQRHELRAMFDEAGVGIATLDGEGRWLTVNRRLCEIVGRADAALVGTPEAALTHPDDRAQGPSPFARMAEGASAVGPLEQRYLRPDGVVVWVRLQLGRIEASDGQPTRLVAVIEDISDRKRAEQQALEHARVRDFHFENTPLAVIEWTPDLRVQRWSARARELYGWREDEVIGRAPSEWRFIHDDDRLQIDTMIDSILHGRRTTEQSLNRNYHKDGRTLWCHWHISVLRDADGRVQSVFSLVKDVSVEQFTLAALRESQSRFQSIFEQAAVGIVMLDAEGNWLSVNQRFREIVGYSSEELLQHSCHTLTEPADWANEVSLRQRLVAGVISDYSFEKRYRRPDGSPVWVSIYARRIEDRGAAQRVGTEVRLTLVVVDITKRRRAEAEVRQLNADLETSVALRTAQLKDTVQQAAQRNQELRVLGKMMTLLPAARDLTESGRIIERFLPMIFSRCAGAVWLEGTGEDRLSLLGTWGVLPTPPLSIARDDCWAMRRGQMLRVDDPADPLQCAHLHRAEPPARPQPHVCVPITALGATVGLIHVEWRETADGTALPPDTVLLRNVTEQVGLAIGNVRLREELRRQAIRDPLTGLYNRRHFDELLRSRIADYARNARGFAVLMIDIDHFKRVNDEHGHDVGDEVLREVGALLLRTVRNDEAAFRLGGEEFVMIVNDVAGARSPVTGCAERVRKAAESMRVVRHDRALPSITVSIGVARYPQDVPHGTDVLQRADAALYIAKRTGRNRVSLAGAMTGLDGIAGSIK